MNIAGSSKAIAGMVVVIVLGFLKQFGILPEMSVNDSVNTIVAGIITYAAIWFAPKNKG